MNRTNFRFEVFRTKSNVAKIAIMDRVLKYRAGGGGYSKDMAVISAMLSDRLNRDVDVETNVGMEGIKLDYLYTTRTNSNIYEVTINEQI